MLNDERETRLETRINGERKRMALNCDKAREKKKKIVYKMITFELNRNEASRDLYATDSHNKGDQMWTNYIHSVHNTVCLTLAVCDDRQNAAERKIPMCLVCKICIKCEWETESDRVGESVHRMCMCEWASDRSSERTSEFIYVHAVSLLHGVMTFVMQKIEYAHLPSDRAGA